jgi:hypothetical protein
LLAQEHDVIELDISHSGVAHDFCAFRRGHHLVRVPESAKLWAALAELAGELIERRAIHRAPRLETKSRDHVACVRTRIGRSRLERRIREHEPERVRPSAITPQSLGRSIERDDVPPCGGHDDRVWVRVDRVLEPVAHDFDGHVVAAWSGRAALRELEEVRALGVVESERLRESLEQTFRDVNVSALLEPRVPAHPHPG